MPQCDGLADPTKGDLVARARTVRVKRYSTIDKDELVAALA